MMGGFHEVLMNFNWLIISRTSLVHLQLTAGSVPPGHWSMHTYAN